MKTYLKRILILFACICLLTSVCAVAFAAEELAITAQPKSVTVEEGATAKVTVKATGDGLKYAWYYKDTGMSSFKKTSTFTGNTYSVAMTTARAGRQVYCKVTDASGASVKTSTATLSMASSLSITAQPKSVTVEEGATAKVTVKATGDGLKYAWYYKDTGMSSFKKTSTFTGNTYSVAMTSARAGRQVYCKVSDKYGNTVKTNTVSLNQAVPVSITAQPKSVTVEEGATAKVTVKATGDGLKYAWYYKDTGMSSFKKTSTFTGSTYSVEMTSARAGRQVYCKVTDKYGNTVKTNTVTLKMTGGVVITQQPISVSVADGATAKVTVKATGDGLTYAWYFKDYKADEFSLTKSFTGNAYSVKMNAARAARQVYCVVSDKYGNSVKTDTVTLDMEVPDGLLYSISGGAVTITGYTGNAARLSIPSVIEGCPVQTIAPEAFKSCSSLTSVSIPDSVNAINREAFRGCTSLTSITIPDSVTTIGLYAFAVCNSLTSVSIPGSVMFIDSGAFNGCDSLTNVSIPDSVTEIGICAFEGCDSLTDIYLSTADDELVRICTRGNSAKVHVSIPDSVTVIGSSAFSCCNSLTSVTIPDSVTVIGESAFMGCTSLTNVTIPDSVTTIGDFAFYGCDSLTSVSIPDSVTSIGDAAFDACPNLTCTVVENSYAHTWCVDNSVPFTIQ